MTKRWHAMENDEVMKNLNVSLITTEGLTEEEAEKRLEEYGYNELKETKRRTALQMFIGEFKDVFVILLIVAATFSAIIGYSESLSGHAEAMEVYADTIVILAIVIMVAITGFVQEYRAEKALEALRRMTAPKARVIRDCKETIIPAKEIVPGDILILETGDHIPADAKILEAVELKTNEAVLTGESTPVNKEITVLKEETPISERRNMLFTATHIVYGRGKAIVTSTGMNTEFGKIAEMVQAAEVEETPLQKKLGRFASLLAKVVIGVCVLIFALSAARTIYDLISAGNLNTEGFIQAFMASISLAISAVPEGLPAVVTITLALGAREFAKRNAIVRRLSSAESLGAVTVICSDKTGTITKGEMTVRQVYTNDELAEVTGVGYEPKGGFELDEKPLSPGEDLNLLLRIGTLCNNAQLRLNKKEGTWEIFGDPTEGALIVSAAKAGLEKDKLEVDYKRVNEFPFTSERKRMTTIHKTTKKEVFAYMKGAPEIILERCSNILENKEEKKLTDSKKKKTLQVNEKLASNAMRVLAMAYKKLPSSSKDYNEEETENDLVFVGLQGMIDPAREEAIEADKLCRKAGIKTVMITGDHKLTATAVAKEVGIFREGDIVLTGIELDKLDEKEFEEIVERVTVYARVAPEHKLKIVKALKKKGHIVSMTGDGVNDAPAVKSADIGVAMGITGTDVTKESSDLVLTDDNFATIVKAVEQGRVIYDNIRKYVRFLIACNFDELLVIGTFAILGAIFSETLFPLPLLPAMILWINLVTDGAPAVALATDPPEKGIMKRKPRNPEEGILTGMGAFIIASFLLQSLGTFIVFSIRYYIWPSYGFGTTETYRVATTIAFIQAAMFEFFVVWNCRSETHSVWRMGRSAFKNKFFTLAILVSVALTVGICYIPLTQQLFHLYPLGITDLALAVAMGSLGLFVFPELLMGKKIWRWK